MPEARQDEFFVGYLPLPASAKRFVFGFALTCLLSFLALAGLAAALRAPIARTQQRSVVLSGRLDARAYGVLWTEIDGSLAPVLVAGGGKFGVPGPAKQLFGRSVEAAGLLLSRSGYHMLELSRIREQPVLPPPLVQALTQLRSEPLGQVELDGEIVDIKCWLGRMKPGEGRTHRACGQFCIHGGIPPVFITSRGSPIAQFVLTDLAGAPINEAVLPFVAEAVHVEGQAERVGDLAFLRIDPAQIRRL